MAKLTRSKESATRKKLDAILVNLGWNNDEESPQCNVFTERCKIPEQTALLNGREPDYVLYESGTDKLLAILEAKRPGLTLTAALKQAIRDYAAPLGIPIIFVSDGSITQTYDSRSNGPLQLDDEPVTNLLSEHTLRRFFVEGPSLYTPKSASLSKQELIRVFAAANDLLRKEGLREGIERFTEFSNLLFLKLVSEIEDDRERRGEARLLDRRYAWDQFSTKPAPDMMDYINDTILPRLADKYNHSGDVFQRKLLIRNPETLKRIVDKLSRLTLLDADSDIKGDAFEYFLKNSVTVGNDLGEYFTPRHVVKVIVELIDPRFGETVYDPCCGTGGFLIETFRHVKQKISQSPDNLEKLRHGTIYGRELTGTAKIAKMNMILTEDGHTNVSQCDSLEHPVHDEYDVVLTNYPFSQTTDFGSYYGLATEDANPVFLKHVIDALKPGGRAGVVVPEGLLFDEKSQYTNVRRILIDQCNLIAVIKLDSYVFRPYTGQPTSILIFEKGKPSKAVWFFDVRDDGFKKTASKRGRAPIRENDLLVLRDLWADKAESDQSFSVSAEEVRGHGYKLNLSEYQEHAVVAGWVKLGGADGICTVVLGGTPSTRDADCWGGAHPWAKISDMQQRIVSRTEKTLSDKGAAALQGRLLPKGTVLVSFKLTIGRVAITGVDLYTNEAIAGLVPKDSRVVPEYLYHVISGLDLLSYSRPAAKGGTLNKTLLEDVRIPLPERDVQLALVRELDAKEQEQERLLADVSRLALERKTALAQFLAKRE